MKTLLLRHSSGALTRACLAIETVLAEKTRRSPRGSVSFDSVVLGTTFCDDLRIATRLEHVSESAGELGVVLPGTLCETDERVVEEMVAWAKTNRCVLHAFVKGNDETNNARATEERKTLPVTTAILERLSKEAGSRWTVRISIFRTVEEAGAQASRMRPWTEAARCECLSIMAVGHDLTGLLDAHLAEFEDAKLNVDWQVVADNPGGMVILSFIVSSGKRGVLLSVGEWKARLLAAFTAPGGDQVFDHLIVKELEGVHAEDLYKRPRGSLVSVRVSGKAMVGIERKLTHMIRNAGGNVTNAQIRPFLTKEGKEKESNSISISYEDSSMGPDRRRKLRGALEANDCHFYRVPTVKENTPSSNPVHRKRRNGIRSRGSSHKGQA